MTTISCCAECGEEGGGLVSLKACKSCMFVMYCNANCQKNHWPTHKKQCKLRAAELHDEALFKDPPPKEDCPICFLPLPSTIISCISLPDATILSVPIFDFANANDGLSTAMVKYYYCCGKSICRGCSYSFNQTGNDEKCPFCNAERTINPEEEIEQMTNRAGEKRWANHKIIQRQWNYSQGQQSLVIVWRILTWVSFIVKGEI
jgi:hypothetical protein